VFGLAGQDGALRKNERASSVLNPKQLFTVKAVFRLDIQPLVSARFKEGVAMASKSELESLEQRIALNNAKRAALKQQRATIHPIALKEHDQQIDRLQRWNAIQERLLLLLREDFGA